MRSGLSGNPVSNTPLLGSWSSIYNQRINSKKRVTRLLGMLVLSGLTWIPINGLPVIAKASSVFKGLKKEFLSLKLKDLIPSAVEKYCLTLSSDQTNLHTTTVKT